jgi:hypothetical protein
MSNKPVLLMYMFNCGGDGFHDWLNKPVGDRSSETSSHPSDTNNNNNLYMIKRLSVPMGNKVWTLPRCSSVETEEQWIENRAKNTQARLQL